ncbi:MAG: short-chain 2-methylacyl-CoA dehydrogenase [Frankiaceae bacterium]|jgi:butyryl-CoA dehydrogenase|nr:short-chain 2-methylacyl-CoA dehydrogenase [Frankiaceae bacterium]
MDFRLSDEHEALRKTVEEFAREVVAPVAEHHDRTEEFPYDVVRQMGEMGLFGLPFPEDYGGMGGDFLALCLAIEELARADSSVAITLEGAVGLGSMPIYRFGSEQQKREWLPQLCRGEALAAFGLTEPGGGTDAGNPRTRAVLDGDEWVINGSKAFITNAGTDLTRLVTVLCRTGERADGRPELTSVLVPVPREGFRASRKYSKVGWHASDTRELVLEDCRVPAESVLGDRGRGYAQFLSTLDEGRVAISALAVGLAQACVDESVRYSREREAFGAPIGSYQGVAFRIADMQLRTHVARLAYYDAAARMAAGAPFKREAAMAKLYSSTIAVDNARDATQVFGGYGFMNEYPVARHWRDAKILEIGEGTSEVQRLLIARSLGLPV